MIKKFSAKVEEFDSNMWNGHIKVPEEIAFFYKAQKVKRLICTLNDEIKIHCAIMSSKEGPYILINKQLRKKIENSINQLIQITLSPDNSKYGMDMPIEFEQCLHLDLESLHYFEALTPGKQRNLIYIVNSIKNPEIKIRRSLTIVEHLKRESGQLDFKKLNELIKENNKRHTLK